MFGSNQWVLICRSVLVFLMACFPASAGTDAPSRLLINEFVPASLGGSFSDDPERPSIAIVIPPGALNGDATLRVRRVRNLGKLGVNQAAASPVFKVTLHRAPRGEDTSGSSPGALLKLGEPMRVEIAADSPPVHPQIGEITVFRNRTWHRMLANFYRPSNYVEVDAKSGAVTRTLPLDLGNGYTIQGTYNWDLN